MDMSQILTIFAIAAANLGTVITLYIQTDNKSELHRRETTEILLGIQQEMKDFHGRLERLDADFKNHLMYHHDELNRKK